MARTHYLQLATLIGLGLGNGAWTFNFRLSQKLTQTGNVTVPVNIEEKEYAYLYCENGEDADRAKKGLIDWRPSTAHEYCWNEHKGSDDTWRSGWERSRLMRGCKWQLNGYGNKIFGCYDMRKDSEFLAMEQALKDERERQHKAWLVQYMAGLDELNLAAGERYGDVDANLTASETARMEAEKVKQKALEETRLAKEAMGRVVDSYNLLETSLLNLSKEFDSGIRKLNDRIHVIGALQTRAEEALDQGVAEIKGHPHDHAFLKDKGASIKALIAEVEPAICAKPDTAQTVSLLRSQVVYTQKLIESLQADAELVSLPASFQSEKDHLMKKIRDLFKVSDQRAFIFDTTYDLLSAKPSVCDRLGFVGLELDQAIALAKRVEDMKRTVGVIENMDRAIASVEAEFLAQTQRFQTVSRARTIQSEFTQFLQGGRISQARNMVETIDQSFLSLSASAAVISDAVAREKTMGEINAIKAEIRADAESRLSLEAAHALISERLRQVKLLLMKAEMKSRTEPSIKVQWALQKPDILTTLNARIGQDILRPVFEDWDSLLAYEQTLSRIEDVLNCLIKNP
jgi:hypothetical protein